MKPTRPYLSPGRAPILPPAPPPERLDPEEPRSRLRRILSRLIESSVAVALTLVCFVALLLLLIRMLPSATDLGDLFTAKETTQVMPARSTLSAALDPTIWKNITLEVIDDEVMRREANSIAWKRAKSGAMLSFGDGIQTTRKGMAVVTFDPSNHLRIGRNSVVILNPVEGDLLDQEGPSASFTVVSGEMWGSFRSGAAPVQLDLPSASSITRLETGGARPAQFKVTVRDDLTSAISVHEGSMKLRNAKGVFQLIEHQYVIVDTAGIVNEPRYLLDPPELLQPRDRDQRVYREFPPKLAFQWTPTGADEYRIVIARDRDLQQVVVDAHVRAASHSVGGITAGDYWWAVSSIQEGAEGSLSAFRRLRIVEDRQAPALAVTFPAARTDHPSVTITGTAEPGSQVFVAGWRVRVLPDGRFTGTTELRPGMNLIVVEALDAVGNSTYRSQEIQLVTEGGSAP